jgi:hypothetical protein
MDRDFWRGVIIGSIIMIALALLVWLLAWS